MKKKYQKSFTPPLQVRQAAKKGLLLRKKFKRGGLTARVAGKLGIGSGVVRAATLAHGHNISSRTVMRMHSYFARHKNDKCKDWDDPKNPSNGYIAWLLWGGDPGKKWVEGIVTKIKRANNSKPK